MTNNTSLDAISTALLTIDQTLVKIEEKNPDLAPSAINLLQYVASAFLCDQALQSALAREGFSSLGRSQSHIRHTVTQILRFVGHGDEKNRTLPMLDYESATRLKHHNAKMFGTSLSKPAIMVTLPSDAVTDEEMIAQLCEEGVTNFRINTAHDSPHEWEQMAKHIRHVQHQTGKDLKIHVDLAGPKIRTSQIKEGKIAIEVGDKIKVVKKQIEGRAVENKFYVAKISCTCEAIFDFIEVGDPLFIDDGNIAGTIISIDEKGFIFEVRSISQKHKKIKAHKGINFPNSRLSLPALTAQDRENLPFITPYADMIGLSFTQCAEDIYDLCDALKAHHSTAAIVPKIETAAGVANLISILLALIASGHQGALMIARGDLAVEVGFENLPLIQQEIIDACHAACIAIIYATQVLESKMKTNIPSRAEAIDAAQASRTDCIMLNKGPFAKEAVETLKQIVLRYKSLYDENRHLLSVMKSWEDEVKAYL